MLLGGDAKDPKISARIGFLPEESYLYRYLTARETLDFYGRLFAIPSRVRKSRIDALLDMVGLQAVANRQVGTFSKGMARRIGLAQALINDPELLILDEPTTGLDPIGTRQIKDLILKLAQRGKTILLSSHLLADVEDVCDRIGIFYGGQVQTLGDVKELLRETDKKQITMTGADEQKLSELGKFLDKMGVEYSVEAPMEKLESFFVKTVTKAQQDKASTSGAVSTTHIGDFLASSQEGEDILDKLTHAKPESQEVETEKTTPSPDKKQEQQTEQKPDEGLLENLAGKDVAESEDNQTEQVETEPVEQNEDSEQVEKKRKDVLDKLTGRDEDKDEDEKASGEDDA
jgi:ABC-2 type transport system ATP-binding protein